MICPLLHSAYLIAKDLREDPPGGTSHVNPVTHCREADCAWWVEPTHRCAMREFVQQTMDALTVLLYDR